MTKMTNDERREAMEGAALDRVMGRRGDRIARDLDLLGWMIVVNPENNNPGRWPMSEPGPCPSWAEPASRPRPALRLVEPPPLDK